MMRSSVDALVVGGAAFVDLARGFDVGDVDCCFTLPAMRPSSR
jgi:hypothetical protein